MREPNVVDEPSMRLFLAGEVVPPGEYLRIDTGAIVALDAVGYLPASLDGQVACYALLTDTWKQHSCADAA